MSGDLDCFGAVFFMKRGTRPPDRRGITISRVREFLEVEMLAGPENRKSYYRGANAALCFARVGEIRRRRRVGIRHAIELLPGGKGWRLL